MLVRSASNFDGHSFATTSQVLLGCAGHDAAPLHHALAILLDYTDENKTAISEPDFKHKLIQQYSSSKQGGTAYCQLTHTFLPKRIVIGSHLWKRAWNKYVNFSLVILLKSLSTLRISYSPLLTDGAIWSESKISTLHAMDCCCSVQLSGVLTTHAPCL